MEKDTEAGELAEGERRRSPFAWAGWQLQLPREWQPLKLSGTPQQGHVLVGGAGWAIFRLQWERLGKRGRIDGPRWVAERFRTLGVFPAQHPPARDRFTVCGWAVGVQTVEGRETTYWFGYAEPARLLLGVIVNGALPRTIRERVLETVLPTLQATPPHKPQIWALYDVSFQVPAGMELVRRRLASGDVALEFTRRGGETLLVRQVYPGDLALRRRPLEAWVEAYPFEEPRRLRHRTLRVEPWQSRHRHELTGIQRTGWKRLPFPLGAWAPRQTRAVAVHDPALNRLLIVEWTARTEPEERVCMAAIEAMNADLRDVRSTAEGTPPSALESPESCAEGPRGAALRARPRRVPPARLEEKAGKLYVTVRFQRPAWQRVLGAERIGERTFGLDPYGRRVYESCDGERSVEAIVAHFAVAVRVSLPEAELVVTRFLRTLVSKGLIVMEMERRGFGR